MAKISNYALLALLGHGANTAQAACEGLIATVPATCTHAAFVAALDPGCNATDFPAELVETVCEKDAPTQFIEIQGTYQLDRRYFHGGGPLVDGGDWKVDAAQIQRFEANSGKKTLIAFPDYAARVQYNINTGRADPDTEDFPNGYPANMNLFNSCGLKTMMCCFTDDGADEGLGTFAANGDATTDVCHHVHEDSPESNFIEAGWQVMPHGETATHCVGFTWTDDEENTLGNKMYDVSLRNTALKGYKDGIPGGPMCGCVEHMPVVAEASCRTASAADVEYQFHFDSEGLRASNTATITYGDCANTDLKAQVIADHPDLEDAIGKRLVGNGGCDAATKGYLNDVQILGEVESPRYLFPDDKWSDLVVGEGTHFQPPDKDASVADAKFRALVDAGCGVGGDRACIIRRICPSCQESHRDVYYRRFTNFPTAGEEDLLDMFMNNWVKEGNDMALGDFKLYSSYQNALDDEDAWTYCDYGPTGGDNHGFPRNCGPSGRVYNNWNSYIRGHGYANHHGFYVELPQTP